jgi:hypothetical protein
VKWRVQGQEESSHCNYETKTVSNLQADLDSSISEVGHPPVENRDEWGSLFCYGIEEIKVPERWASPPPAPLKGIFGTPYNNWFAIWFQYQDAAAWRYKPKEHVTHRIKFDDQLVP